VGINSYAAGRRRPVSTCVEKEQSKKEQSKKEQSKKEQSIYTRRVSLCPRRRTLGASPHSVGIHSYASSVSVSQFFARHGRRCIAAYATFCLALASGGCHHSVQNVDTLGGKWVGKITWNDASGQPYQQTMRTALFFLPHNVAGTVITFPTGAIGGAGNYTLEGSRLTVRCTSLSVNGRSVPLSTFSHAPWYHSAPSYRVSYDNGDLVLTPAAPGPTPAPCWPLLASPKPLVLSRREPPQADSPAAPAPRE